MHSGMLFAFDCCTSVVVFLVCVNVTVCTILRNYTTLPETNILQKAFYIFASSRVLMRAESSWLARSTRDAAIHVLLLLANFLSLVAFP